MKDWIKHLCLAFVFLNLFSAGLNFVIGNGLLVIIVNLIIAGVCWHAYVSCE